jgi:hypothetical protein
MSDDPLEWRFSCSNPDDAFFELTRFNNSLPVELRRRFSDIRLGMLGDEFEQLNGRTLAQIFAEYGHIGDAQAASRERKSEVRRIACKGSAAELQTLSCPLCGQGLSIRFDPHAPQLSGATAGCVHIDCWDCTQAIASGIVVNGLKETPPWVASLGFEVETRGSNEG